MDKQLKVFICSTYADLLEEQERVLQTVRTVQMEHQSMEFFGARAGQPIETCLKEVRASDILVVIVGHLYGSLVPKRALSFTQAEYEEGRRLGMPALVYIRDEDVPVLPRFTERDPEKLRLLVKFKQDLMAQHTVAPFSGADDLSEKVDADLRRTAELLLSSRNEIEGHTTPAQAGEDSALAQRFRNAARLYEEERYEQAFAAFESLGTEGHASSQRYLGLMFERGLGVPADIAQAMTWLVRAADSGDLASQRLIRGLTLVQPAWIGPLAVDTHETDWA